LIGAGILSELGIEGDKEMRPMVVSLADIKYFFEYEMESGGTYYTGVCIQYHSSVMDTQVFALCKYQDFRDAYYKFMESLQALDIQLETDGN